MEYKYIKIMIYDGYSNRTLRHYKVNHNFMVGMFPAYTYRDTLCVVVWKELAHARPSQLSTLCEESPPCQSQPPRVCRRQR